MTYEHDTSQPVAAEMQLSFAGSVRRTAAILGVTLVALTAAEQAVAPAVSMADTCTTTQTTNPDGSTTSTTSCTSENSSSQTSTTSSMPSSGASTQTGETPSSSAPTKSNTKQPNSTSEHHSKSSHSSHTQRHKKRVIKNIYDFYQNPLRDIQHLRPWRIDMGVDYSGSGNVYALGKGVVTLATTNSSFWAGEGGNVVVYRLEEGPAKGSSVYVSENGTPEVHPGERVSSRTPVFYMHDAWPNIETGWATGGTDKPRAWRFYTPAGNPDGSKTADGANFSILMVKLGAPEGNSNPAHTSTNPNLTVGYLPQYFPTWGK